MDHIIHEVDEDLKRERLHQLWRNFGTHIVMFSVAVLVGTASIVGYKQYITSRNETETDILVQASEMIDAKKPADAKKLLEQHVGEMHDALQIMAQLWLGQLYHNDGDMAKANGYYAQVSSQKQEPELAAYAALLQENTPKEFENSAVFAALLKEKKASQLLHEGKKAEAVALLQALEKDATTPGSMRARLNLLILGNETGAAIAPKTTAP